LRAIAVALLFAVLHVPAEQAPPSSSAFDADSAIVTILIRPDKTADFEGVLEKLRQALQRSNKPQRKAQAAGWRVYRSLESAEGQAVYVMHIDPVIRGQEYDITKIIAEEFPADVAGTFKQYQGALVGRSVITADRLTVGGLGVANGGAAAVAAGDANRATQRLTLSFDANAAMITVLTRPERTADLESTLGFLGKSLQASAKPGRRDQAAGWKVFKSQQSINGNTAYVMVLDPVLQDHEYDIISLIAETHPLEIQPIFQKYREAVIGRAIARLKPLMTLAP
jgi:hypothetical protein